MTRGGMRGRGRGGVLRGALSLRGVFLLDIVCHPTIDQARLTSYSLLINLCLWLYGSTFSNVSMCCTGKRVPMGSPMRGRGSVGRIAMRRGGRHRGGLGGRGGTLSRGVARGGIVRGEIDSIFIIINFIFT